MDISYNKDFFDCVFREMALKVGDKIKVLVEGEVPSKDGGTCKEYVGYYDGFTEDGIFCSIDSQNREKLLISKILTLKAIKKNCLVPTYIKFHI